MDVLALLWSAEDVNVLDVWAGTKEFLDEDLSHETWRNGQIDW